MNRSQYMLVAGVAMVAFNGVASYGAVFTHGYEGDHLPQDALTSPQWAKVLDNGDTSESAEDGILTVYSGSRSSYIEYRLNGGTGSAWDPKGSGSTIETRFKTNFAVTTEEDNNLYAGFMIIHTGQRYWTLYIGPGYITDPNGGFLPVTTSDDFHTYRFVIADEQDGTLDLYIDNAFDVPAYSWNGTAGSANYLGFGDGSSGELAGQIQWDYIRWANDGAFVPEPSMLALTLPVLLGLRRRPRS